MFKRSHINQNLRENRISDGSDAPLVIITPGGGEYLKILKCFNLFSA